MTAKNIPVKKTQPINGPAYLANGFKLLFHPSLRWFVVIPLVMNLAIFISLTYYAAMQFDFALEWIMHFVPAWLDFLSWILWVLFTLILLVIYGYTFTLVATLIASPFYGLLAEQAEYLLSGTKRDEPLTLKTAWVIAKRSMHRELIKLWYFLPRILGVFVLGLILSFIPGLNLLGPVIALIWGGWSLALQYTDYAADNNLMPFTALRGCARQHKISCFSFGGTVLFATSIPLLNLLAIPASVIAGTALWLDQLQPDKQAGNLPK